MLLRILASYLEAAAIFREGVMKELLGWDDI
jgi:hypothetical protein